MENKSYRVYWRDGKSEVLNGNSISDAFNRVGYGRGALGALDFYGEGEEAHYEWNTTTKKWDQKKY